MSNLKQIEGRWQGRGYAAPRTFFQSDEAGFYLDFATTQQLYQDNAAATPLTTPDQAVGLVADRSRARSPITVAAAVQASLGLRPKWGRGPKSRRNRMLESAGSTGWAAAGSTAPTVTNGVTYLGNSCMSVLFAAGSPNGYLNCRAARNIQVTPWSGGVTYAQSLDIALSRPLVGAEALQVILYSSVGLMGSYTINAANSATLAAGAFVRLSHTGVGGAGTGSLWPVITPSGTLASDVTVYSKNIQIEVAPASAYQTVGTTILDMTEASIPTFGFIRPDMLDDVLTATVPAAQTGDVLVFGRNGSWIETGVTYGSGSAWSIGANTVTGLPQGLLTAIGDIVGIVAIGRTLTAAERTMALEYHKARGAAAWLVAGAEGVVNGGFATDTVWTKGTGWTIGAGVATHAAGLGSDIEQAGLLTAGVAYLLTVDLAAVRATSIMYVHDGAAYMEIVPTLTVGTKKAVFVAKATRQLSIRLGSLADADIDNVSLKPLTVSP